MNNQIFKAALAGMLQDIDQFGQRAGEQVSPVSIETIVPVMWYDDVAEMIAADRPTGLIPLARRLAAGGLAGEGQTAPRQLQSIFGSITGLRDQNDQPIAAPAGQYLPLKKLTIQQEVIFPGNEATDPKGDYLALWQAFTQEAVSLKAATERNQSDLKDYLPSLLDLMQQYTWCVPAVAADVSLYDHSRMTAALAACLADLPTLPAEDSTEPMALLVGGDISGVQKFIYNITSRGATPGLRGRSMYLQLLTESITRYLLDALDLPSTNVIYAGGGHLYLVVPLSAQEKLPKLQQRISRILLHHHQGDLYLALTNQKIAPAQFSGEAFHLCWEALQQKLQLAKQQKFAELGEELAERLFEPMEDGGNEDKQCVVCQREHPDTKTGDESNPDRTRKCPVCEGFEDLGDKLRNAQYLCLDQIEPTEEPKPKERRTEWNKILEQFGYTVRVAETLGEITSVDRQTVKRRNVLALSDTARDKLDTGAGQTIGRRLLVNVTPQLLAKEVAIYNGKIEDVAELRPDNVKPFEILAQQSKGFNRLGVLRMDVDNLGQIFSQGLPASSFTISRMAALSFRMSLFFEGWLSEIAQQIEQKSPYVLKQPESGEPIEITQRLYSIYSGGDDLFFVGAWDLMPILAERINNDLQKYSGHHPGLHISGGISLASAKYPLYQAAEDAAEAESAAKAPRPNLTSDQPDEMVAKNALAFLGEVIPWEKYGEVAQWQIDLVDLVENKNGPRGVLQRLRELYIVFDKQREAQAKEGVTLKVYWGPGQWRSAYSLSRLAQQYEKKNQPVSKMLEEIRNKLSLENFTNIQWLGLAARWAALLTRKGE